jgi:hypothetical protein
MKRITLAVYNGITEYMEILDEKIIQERRYNNNRASMNLPQPEAMIFCNNKVNELNLCQEEVKIAKKEMFLSWSDSPKKVSLKMHLDKIFSLELDDVLTIDMDNITGIKTAYYKAVKGTDKKFTFNRVGDQWKITRLR